MSTILRRPMFRGGPVSSEGTGITSGLNEGYATGGRVGYAGAGLVNYGQREALESMYGKDAIQNAYQKEIDRYKENIKNLQARSGMLSEDPESSVFLPNVVTDISRQEAKLESLKSPEGKTAFEKAKINEFNRIRQSQGLESLTPKEEPKIEEDVTKEMVKRKELPTLAEDIDTYTKLLMENAGPDKDEYTRQKYLTLAKFGLNLLKPTPAGVKPNILSSIASAAEKPLEEYGSISMQQSKEDRALRQAAAQLAVQKHMPSNLGKSIQDLMASNPNMTAEEAISLVTTGKNKHALDREKFNEISQKQKDIEDLATKDPSMKKLLKVDPSFSNTYARIAVEQGLYGHELKGLASDYSVYQPGAIYYAPDKKTGELIPHKYIKGKFYSIREPEFKLKGI